ncbi:TetR/AcrR family transcriptional regulator [Paenibacillus algorifonticola]|uniref:TetR/AcrR family transcriptional regulator n=1 Tax=Paenibacillus algorifonticola TaxID=684063 RepID=UPI003D2758C4
MVKDKVDLRIVKTRKAIKESFLKLVQTKGYERITVQDIADEAMINRNTFYLHYVDKPDLMEKLCQENVEKLNVCFSLEVNNFHESSKELLISVLNNLFNVIKSNMVFFKTMLSQNGQPHFSTYLKEALKTFFLAGISKSHNHLKMTVGLEYMISGLVGVIGLWIMDSEQYQVEEIIEQLSEIHFKNVLDLLKNIQPQ